MRRSLRVLEVSPGSFWRWRPDCDGVGHRGVALRAGCDGAKRSGLAHQV